MTWKATGMRKRGGHEPVKAASAVYVSPAQVKAVLPELDEKWSRNALAIQERLTQAIDRDDAAAAQKWSISAGIASEKTLLMKGRPTEIVANLHAHRHDLSDVMEKMAKAARVVSVHQRKGYMASDRGPAPLALVPISKDSTTDSGHLAQAEANSASDATQVPVT